MIWHRTFPLVSRLWLAATFTFILVSACTQVPELDEKVDGNLRKLPYPKLVPLDEVLISVPLPRVQAGEIEQSITARQARLEARARGLDSPVVDAASRKRMQDGVGQ